MGDWEVKCLKCGNVVVIHDILEQPNGCSNCGNHCFEVVRTPQGEDLDGKDPPIIAS